MSATAARKAYRQTNNGRVSDSETEFNEVTDFYVPFVKDTADSASATVSTDLPFYPYTPYTFDVIAAYWMTKTTLTANATAYVTVTLDKNNAGSGAGSTMIAIGAVNSQSTSFTARTKRALTITTANRQVPSGYAMYVNIAKASAGKKCPIGTLVVHCRRV